MVEARRDHNTQTHWTDDQNTKRGHHHGVTKYEFNEFNSKFHYLKKLFQVLELSYEGFHCCQDYLNVSVVGGLQDEDCSQRDFYYHLFEETLLAVDQFFQEMQDGLIPNMEGN